MTRMKLISIVRQIPRDHISQIPRDHLSFCLGSTPWHVHSATNRFDSNNHSLYKSLRFQRPFSLQITSIPMTILSTNGFDSDDHSLYKSLRFQRPFSLQITSIPMTILSTNGFDSNDHSLYKSLRFRWPFSLQMASIPMTILSTNHFDSNDHSRYKSLRFQQPFSLQIASIPMTIPITNRSDSNHIALGLPDLSHLTKSQVQSVQLVIATSLRNGITSSNSALASNLPENYGILFYHSLLQNNNNSTHN